VAVECWSLTLRLPERPTMPCPICEGSRSVGEPGYTYYGIPEPGSYEPCPDCMDDHGIPDGRIPIPEGTRVDVGYPCDCSEHQPGLHINTAKCPHNRTGGMVPVAFATLTEVRHVLQAGIPWTEGRNDYEVTLSDIEPAGEDRP